MKKLMMILLVLSPGFAHAACFSFLGQKSQINLRQSFQATLMLMPEDSEIQSVLQLKVGGLTTSTTLFCSETDGDCRMEDDGGAVKFARKDGQVVLTLKGIFKIVEEDHVHRMSLPTSGRGKDVPYLFTQTDEAACKNLVPQE